MLHSRLTIFILWAVMVSLPICRSYSADSPYLACLQHSTNSPPAGFFNFDIAQSDKQGITSKEFLLTANQRVKNYLHLNEQTTHVMSMCLSTRAAQVNVGGENFDCEYTFDFFTNEFPALIHYARQELALAFTAEGALPAHLSVPDMSLNYNLNALFEFKSLAWQKLSAEEVTNAEALWQIDVATAKDIVSKKTIPRRDTLTLMDLADYRMRQTAETLKKIRILHRANYHTVMQNITLLNYIKSENPTMGELLEAFKKLSQNNHDEQILLDKATASIQSRDHIDLSSLSVLKYSPIIQEFLLKEPKYCSIATSLAQYQVSQNERNMVVIAPAIIASLFAPPLLGFAVGSISTLFWASDSYMTYQDNLRSAMIGAYGADAVFSASEAREALADNLFQIGTAPLLFLTGTTKMIQTGRNLLKAQLQARKAMQNFTLLERRALAQVKH